MATLELGWDDGKRKRKYLYAPTKKEAADKLHEAQGQAKAGTVSNDSLTLGDHLARWQSDVLPGKVTPNTADNYATMIKKHIAPTLGKKRLAKLGPEDVARLLRTKTDAGYKPRTVSLIRTILVMSLKQAERWGTVNRNVAALTDGPRQSKREGRSLTAEQAQALLEAAQGDRLEALYVIMLSLGLRRGEALGLSWEDVDLDEAQVHIRHGLKREGGKLVVGDLKTESSKATLNLSAREVDALRRHRRLQAEERLRLGAAWVDTGLVFTTTVGTAVDPDNLRHAFDRLCRRAGLGHWHPHELRHTAASLTIGEGVSLYDVSKILRHSSPRITGDVYAHQLAPARQAVADARDRALGERGNGSSAP